MRRSLCLVSLLLLLLGGDSLSGAPRPRAPLRSSASPFFPLRVGNRWVYQDDWSTAPPSTIAVTDQIAGPDGFAYFTLLNYLPTPRQVRSDRTGRVQEIDPDSGDKALWYLLGAPAGTAWSYLPLGYDRFNCLADPKARVSSRTDTVQVPAGEFHDVVRIDFENGCLDAGLMSEWFAPGIGLIKRTTESIAGPRSMELVATNASSPHPEFSVSLTLDRAVYIQDAMPVLDPLHLASLDALLVLRNQGPPIDFTFQGCKSATFRVLGADGTEWIRARGDDGLCCQCPFPVTFQLRGNSLFFQARIPLVLQNGSPLPGGSYTLEATLDDVELPEGLRPSARLPFTVILLQ